MSKSTPNKDLIGKGLRSLLQNMDADFKNPAGKVQPAAIEKAIAINRIALTNIIVNPKNPRKDFDEKALQELAQSLKMHDLIQPITVAQLTNGKFQLIAGERRFRAAKIAGLTDVPAYIRLGNDKELLELALLKNAVSNDEIKREALRFSNICTIRYVDSNKNEQRLFIKPKDIKTKVITIPHGTGVGKAFLNLDDFVKSTENFEKLFKEVETITKIQNHNQIVHLVKSKINNSTTDEIRKFKSELTKVLLVDIKTTTQLLETFNKLVFLEGLEIDAKEYLRYILYEALIDRR